MKTRRAVILGASALLLAGCAASLKTKAFYAEEDRIAKSCTAPLMRMQPGELFIVSPTTGRSPVTESAICYRQAIYPAVVASGYQHAEYVHRFADFLVTLTQQRDAGMIETQTAITVYVNAAKQFKSTIAIADSAHEERERRKFADSLAAFGAAYAGAVAASQAQAYTQRPITCRDIGIYAASGTFVCN